MAAATARGGNGWPGMSHLPPLRESHVAYLRRVSSAAFLSFAFSIQGILYHVHDSGASGAPMSDANPSDSARPLPANMHCDGVHSGASSTGADV